MLLTGILFYKLITRAIYDGDTMVGFLMYGEDPKTNRLEICRLMVDKQYQNRGIGKAAMRTIMNHIEKEYGTVELYTSLVPNNEQAKGFVCNLGFQETGEIMWEEEVMKISLGK